MYDILFLLNSFFKKKLQQPANLIPELCRNFYQVGIARNMYKRRAISLQAGMGHRDRRWDQHTRRVSLVSFLPDSIAPKI